MATEKIESEAPPLDKDPFDISKVQDEQPYDAIVIGSGVGGLTAASFLAQEGQRVLVLEQHQIAGGCCHTFELGGYRFGTGECWVKESDVVVGLLGSQNHAPHSQRGSTFCRRALRRRFGRRQALQPSCLAQQCDHRR